MYLSYAMWVVAIAVAVMRPDMGETAFGWLEGVWRRAARHGTAAWVGVGLVALGLRALLLPWVGIPEPVIYDEFSYLLGADTFAGGRVANASPAVVPGFESPYVLQRPVYASKYPPGPAVTMAVGQRIFGHPWFGVWLTAGLMCASICWALQGWLPAEWALLGGVMSLPLGVMTYWVDSYWGGALAAFGGALVLGGYARRWGWAMGAGLVILANSRMFEGALVGAVVVVGLLGRGHWRVLARVGAVLAAGAALMGWYDWRVTGDALRMPYLEYERQYSVAPFFSFLPVGQMHFFANPVMEDLHRNWDVRAWEAARSFAVFGKRPAEWWRTGHTIFGATVWLMVLLGAVPVLMRRREWRVPVWCVGLALAGSFVEISYFDHYAGPVVAALFLLAVAGLRELRGVEFRGRAAGRFLSRAIPAGAFLLILRAEVPVVWEHRGFEATHAVNARKGRLERELTAKPGQHLVLVRYTGNQSPHEEWVYNRADLAAARVVWAHDLGELENKRLVANFPGRVVWLFEPDVDPERFVRVGGGGGE